MVYDKECMKRHTTRRGILPHRVVYLLFAIYLVKAPIAHPVTCGMPSVHTAMPFEDPFRP